VVDDAPAQVPEIAPSPGVGVDAMDPRLDGVVARLGGDFDLFLDAELLAADGAGIETVAKRTFRPARGRPGAGGRLRAARQHGRPERRTGGRHKVPPGKLTLCHG